jgi:capsular exopolysaccharide synthesis family protein
VAPTSSSTTRQTDGELSLAELLEVVQRHRWLLLAWLLLGGLAGVGIVASVAPTYEARALLIIEPARGGGSGATVASASDTLDSASVDSQVQILASRSLAREVIGQLGLEADPELAAAAGGILGRLMPALAGEAAPQPVDAVGSFLARLAVRREGKSHVIAIGYRSGDPARAAAVANKLAELYMVGQLARKYEAARRHSGWFDERLAALKGQLDAAEAALQRFRAETEAARGEAYGAEPEELAGLNGQVVAAAVERSGKEATLERVRQLVERGNPGGTVGELGSSPLLANLAALKAELLRREAELTARYGERHPKILDVRAEKAELDTRLQEEQRALLRQLGSEVERARAKERTLAGKLAELKGKALRREDTVQRLQELEHEVELSRRLYEAHVAGAGASERPAEGQEEPDARVISEAVAPGEPSWPRPRLVLSLSLTGGLLLGIAAMYLAEAGDRGFRSAREVEEALGLSTLALVPKLDPGRSKGVAPQDYALERPRSRYAEALRELLAGILRRGEEEAAAGGRTVLVTSALPREGKSTLVLSLARVAAAEGLRVLVVDADLRKPSLHDLAGLKPGAGLVEVLRRELPLAEVVVTDPRAPLKLLPGSQRLAQPTRLLGPEGLGVLLTALRRSFDLILVDSAPLVAVADPRLIAGRVDAVLLAVRYGETRKAFCRSCLQGLAESGAVLAGAVLTQVDLRRHAGSFARDAGVSAEGLRAYYSD